MPSRLRQPATWNRGRSIPVPLYLGFATAVGFFILSGYLATRNVLSLRDTARQIERTHSVIDSHQNALLLIKDAETGQRGYLITGSEAYLQPYHSALAGLGAELAQLKELVADSPGQHELSLKLERLVASKLSELEETIRVQRDEGFEAARAVVLTDRGKQVMDDIRENLSAMNREENRIRDLQIEERREIQRVTLASGISTALLGIILSCAVSWLVRRAHLLRFRQEWAQEGKLELSNAMSGEKGLVALAESTLAFLARYLEAQAGALFVFRDGHFDRVALVGAPLKDGAPARFQANEGLLGRVAAEKMLLQVKDVPEDLLMVASGLCNGAPKHLVILPALVDDQVNAVIELGFLRPLDAEKEEFLVQLSGQVGTAMKTALYWENLQELLEETQRQSEELQAQGEELRVSNEELEEQSRALRESQANLELQQVEMEQTNLQLEEQTRQLEEQAEDLLAGQRSLREQARAVEQASRFKSDFLANMSHELRTPLNSSLILARLLSDNKPGNLTEEQIKFARTIESAGNDLLSLINDVLDLSKIEAGHVEVQCEPISVARLVTNLTNTFEPVALQKGVSFGIEVLPDVPEMFESDSQRLEQVVKNLLSNALKFTAEGSVKVTFGRVGEGQISISVADTGIGIDPAHQRMIFEPFSQADSSTARKFGGTGLGLSISRHLTRLLGGTLGLQSEPGAGSTFTLLIPLHCDARETHVSAPAPVVGEPLPASPSGAPIHVGRLPDDRKNLTGDQRVILVVEDDEIFAGIINDLVHELSFKCLIATSAEEALMLAREHRPDAIILDVRLPDHSGLLVLERLKSDASTRHIPVHVVSAEDFSGTARALGAAGSILKPVRREQLIDMLRQLEERFTRRMRRVLVVEDDPVQREALGHLIGSEDVETVFASSAAECLQKLERDTYDCMVLDLSLPDSTGFELLEKLHAEKDYSFPPVIVYTGRVLSEAEEETLRGYSQSVIIKGAKSPERLLDEVMLFLHQVVSHLPPEKQRMIERANNRDTTLEGRRILVAEDDVRNVFALTSVLEGRGAVLRIARNGKEALAALEEESGSADPVSLVLMDIMMPEMDGLTAIREIRKNPRWEKLPIIALTAKAMKNDQQECLEAGASDYLAKPLDVDKLLSLIRVWMPR